MQKQNTSTVHFKHKMNINPCLLVPLFISPDSSIIFYPNLSCFKEIDGQGWVEVPLSLGDVIGYTYLSEYTGKLGEGQNLNFFFFFFFSGMHLWHMEVSGVGVKSELQPLAYTTVRATPDPSRVCDLYYREKNQKKQTKMGSGHLINKSESILQTHKRK